VQVTTKGDANTAAENWRVPASGRVGQTLLRIPAAGRLVRASTSRPARVLAVLLAFGYLGARLLRRVWRRAAGACPTQVT
jgi:hypothetical protein